MKKINPDKFYSGIQAASLIGFKARQMVIKYIREGQLQALIISDGKQGGVRYALRGEWILDFIERYDKGLVDKDKFTVKLIKKTMKEALEYCEKNGIKTLDKYVKSVNKL